MYNQEVFTEMYKGQELHKEMKDKKVKYMNEAFEKSKMVVETSMAKKENNEIDFEQVSPMKLGDLALLGIYEQSELVMDSAFLNRLQRINSF